MIKRFSQIERRGRNKHFLLYIIFVLLTKLDQLKIKINMVLRKGILINDDKQ